MIQLLGHNNVAFSVNRCLLAPPVKTLTLLDNGHGTLSATKVTGHYGETIELIPQRDTYYRLDSYDVTGGTIEGNTYTFGLDNSQTAKANFVINAFTASGGFEHGTNFEIHTLNRISTDISRKYATASYYTDNVPSSYLGSANRWCPDINVSGYYMKMTKPSLVVKSSGTEGINYITGSILVGDTVLKTLTGSNGTKTGYASAYSASAAITTPARDYALSGHFEVVNTSEYGANFRYGIYQSNLTTGTWSASGYIP